MKTQEKNIRKEQQDAQLASIAAELHIIICSSDPPVAGETLHFCAIRAQFQLHVLTVPVEIGESRSSLKPQTHQNHRAYFLIRLHQNSAALLQKSVEPHTQMTTDLKIFLLDLS